jgi:hypothetical protein
MSTFTRPDPDQHVSPNWKPVAALAERRPGLHWTDWLFHALVCLGGLAVMAVGGLAVVFVGLAKIGGLVCAAGFVMFALGFPSDAQLRGYRE